MSNDLNYVHPENTFKLISVGENNLTFLSASLRDFSLWFGAIRTSAWSKSGLSKGQLSLVFQLFVTWLFSATWHFFCCPAHTVGNTTAILQTHLVVPAECWFQSHISDSNILALVLKGEVWLCQVQALVTWFALLQDWKKEFKPGCTLGLFLGKQVPEANIQGREEHGPAMLGGCLHPQGCWDTHPSLSCASGGVHRPSVKFHLLPYSVGKYL